MTTDLIQYKLTAQRNMQNGRYVGQLFYGDELVAETPDDGLKNEKALDSWAFEAGYAHKASLTPPIPEPVKTTTVEHIFSL